jgi:hypothetical protein
MVGIQVQQSSRKINDLLPLSDRQLDEILRITDVAQEHRDFVRLTISKALNVPRIQHRRGPYRSPFPPDLIRLLKRTAQRSSDLRSTVNELLGRRHELPTWFPLYAVAVRPDQDEFDDLYALNERIAALALNCAGMAITRLSTRKKKAPHRPRGTIKHPTLSHLIRALHEGIAERCGGKLTVSKNESGKCKGTLPAVFTVLRDIAPEIIPSVLPPYSTLRRLLHDAERRHGGQDTPKRSR